MAKKILEERVTIETAVVNDENGTLNALAAASPREGLVPNRRYTYCVTVARESFKVHSVNQQYAVGSRAGVLFRGKKCELLYDAIFYTAQPFCLDSHLFRLRFFDGETVERLTDVRYVAWKRDSFLGRKKRLKALERCDDTVATDALIIGRTYKGELQLFGLHYVMYDLTVLLKTDDGYAVTVVSRCDRIGKKHRNFFDTAFTFSTGEIIPLLYRRGNIADNRIDEPRVVPFSLQKIPRIESLDDPRLDKYRDDPKYFTRDDN